MFSEMPSSHITSSVPRNENTMPWVTQNATEGRMNNSKETNTSTIDCRPFLVSVSMRLSNSFDESRHSATLTPSGSRGFS